MKLTHLTAVLLATLPATGVFAAALDRSGQSMNAFFQEGNYFEAGFAVLDPNVSGKETGQTTRTIEDMGSSYYFPTAAIKLQPHEKISVGLLYDQPFGANAEYTGSNKFVANTAETTVANQAMATTLIQQAVAQGATLAQAQAAVTTQLTGLQQLSAKTPTNSTQGTHVDVHTQSLSLVAGYQPTNNWNIYAGAVYQTVKADINLRGTAYSVYNGYDLTVNETGGVGYLAGIAYQKPEIALRAALTYRSEIDHEFTAKENFTNIPTTAKSKVTTPQSINLDLQTGIAENTLAFANIRWVDWSNFKFQPNKFGQVSRKLSPVTGKSEFNLVEYSKDQISANVGVGRKFSDQWSGSVSVGWDSGAGNPVTTLGPTEGYWNTGVGVQFSPSKNTFISGGVKYFWLGDAKAQTGAQAGTNSSIAEFNDNHAIAYAVKLGYRF